MQLDLEHVVTWAGAVAFGLVIGWMTSSIFRRANRSSLDIATIIGAIAGGVITGLFPVPSGAFSFYCIGLVIGFFGYIAAAWGKNSPDWLGRETAGQAPPAGGPGPKGGLPPVAKD
jgi:uncharacterized membrane protein YeaQ/YmgE (transglycosylase-associated protein family)